MTATKAAKILGCSVPTALLRLRETGVAPTQPNGKREDWTDEAVARAVSTGARVSATAHADALLHDACACARNGDATGAAFKIVEAATAYRVSRGL